MSFSIIIDTCLTRTRKHDFKESMLAATAAASVPSAPACPPVKGADDEEGEARKPHPLHHQPPSQVDTLEHLAHSQLQLSLIHI